MIRKPKTIKCKVKGCQTRFEPRQPWQRACSPEHAIELVIADKLKKVAAAKRKESQENAARRTKLKTRSDYIKECQTEFNALVRARDKSLGYPCISSGEVLDWSGNKTDAGHYRSVGSAPHLRFNLDNCHAQSKKANQWLSGDAVNYRIGLIGRIGIERVEALEADQSSPKWTIPELQQMKLEFRELRKVFEKD